MMMSQRWPKSKAAATAVLGLCLVAFVMLDEQSYTSQYLYDGRRSLKVDNRKLRSINRHRNQRRAQRLQITKETLDIDTMKSDNEPSLQERLANLEDRTAMLTIDSMQDKKTRALQLASEEGSNEEEGDVYPWAKSSLVPLSELPDPEREAALFWHIPKSGGSTAKAIYRCLGKRLHILSKAEDIEYAREHKLIEGIDVVFSSFPNNVIQSLLNQERRGRVLAIFRHPVDRLISKFYYLQVATWEKTYHAHWKYLSLLDWTKNGNMDNNHYVKKLAGKLQRDPATEEDLELAKHTIKSYFVVGLMNDMEESMRRFNVVLGIDDVNDDRNRSCMNSFFPGENPQFRRLTIGNRNSNAHPKVNKDDPAYQLLAEMNSLDVRLYEYIEELFDKQKGLIQSYKSTQQIDGALETMRLITLTSVEEEVAGKQLKKKEVKGK